MALCIECMPAVQEVPGSIPDCDTLIASRSRPSLLSSGCSPTFYAEDIGGPGQAPTMWRLAIFCLLFRFEAKLSSGEAKRKSFNAKRSIKSVFFGLRAQKCVVSFRSCFPKWCRSETKKNRFSQNDADTCESGSEPAVSHIKNVISLRDISLIITHGHRLIIWGSFWDESPSPCSLRVAFSLHRRVYLWEDAKQGEKLVWIKSNRQSDS